jgi:hypothetical protein
MGTRRTEIGRTGARFGSIGAQQKPGKHEAPAEPVRSPGETPDPAVTGTRVGFTGARFGPGLEPRRTPDDADEPPPEVAAEPDPAVPLTGARFGPRSERWRRRDDTEELPVILASGPDPAIDLADLAVRPREEHRVGPLPSESEVLIRPYARTGGRTKPTHDLALEALICTVPHAAQVIWRHPSWEHRRIASLCQRPRSVAEVAALLAIPLGVARILLVDMVAAGAVMVHGATGHGAPDLVLMNRVLAGLRRL